MSNQNGNAVATAAGVKTAYDSSVAVRAVERAGHNPNLKGTVHEIMRQDRLNINAENLINGKQAVLSKSPTAVRDDIVLL